MYTLLTLFNITVLSVISFSGSKFLRISWEVNIFFNLSKAFCAFLNYLNFVLFFVNSVSNIIIFEYFFTNFL